MKAEVVELADDVVDGPSSSKRVKHESVDANAGAQMDAGDAGELPQEPNTILYLCREEVKVLSKAEIRLLLEFNNQLVPSKKDEVID